MTQTALQRLKEKFSLTGLGSKQKEQRTRFFSDLELTSLKSQLKAGNQKAREAVLKAGAAIHPRIEQLRK